MGEHVGAINDIKRVVRELGQPCALQLLQVDVADVVKAFRRVVSIFAEVSAPVQDRQCGANSRPIRPTPQPISRTSSCVLTDANASKLSIVCFAEWRNSSSDCFPDVAAAASLGEAASESQTFAYCLRWR